MTLTPELPRISAVGRVLALSDRNEVFVKTKTYTKPAPRRRTELFVVSEVQPELRQCTYWLLPPPRTDWNLPIHVSAVVTAKIIGCSLVTASMLTSELQTITEDGRYSVSSTPSRNFENWRSVIGAVTLPRNATARAGYRDSFPLVRHVDGRCRENHLCR